MNIRVYIRTYETLKRVLFILDLSLKQIGLVTFARYTCMVDNMFQCLRDQHYITHACAHTTFWLFYAIQPNCPQQKSGAHDGTLMIGSADFNWLSQPTRIQAVIITCFDNFCRIWYTKL